MDSRDSNWHVWAQLAVLLGIVFFVVILFWPSFRSIIALWDTASHRHGMLVFPIAAFLIWRLRHELVRLKFKVGPAGLLLLIPLVGIWMGGRLAGVQVVEHFAAVAIIPASIGLFVGRSTAATLAFPLIFTLFATPITDTFIPSLMVVTADISTALLELSGFPVFREGQYISLPGGDFVVAEVCSGVRYLITGVMIAALYGYLTFASIAKRLTLIAVTAVVLIIANGLRAYIVMAVAITSTLAGCCLAFS